MRTCLINYFSRHHELKIRIAILLYQTHSWNKGGLKLFHFREHGPFDSYTFIPPEWVVCNAVAWYLLDTTHTYHGCMQFTRLQTLWRYYLLHKLAHLDLEIRLYMQRNTTFIFSTGMNITIVCSEIVKCV